VAGVIDIAGTLFDVWSDKAGFGLLSRSCEWSGVGNFLDVGGRGEEMTMGTRSRGRDRDLRRGGEDAGGSVITFLEGERPRGGLNKKGLRQPMKTKHAERPGENKAYLGSELSRTASSENLVSECSLLTKLSGPMLPLRWLDRSPSLSFLLPIRRLPSLLRENACFKDLPRACFPDFVDGGRF